MGKTPVVVADCPGFLVNRILAPYVLGFLQAIHDGADYLALDRVMENFGWPMGPAYLQDIIGMDTSAHALGVVADSYRPRMPLNFENALQKLVRHGRLGQKSGSGFYSYSKTHSGQLQKTLDLATAGLMEQIQPGGPRPMTDEELRDRLMLPMILEAARCLDERVVGTAAEIDLSLTLGIGFPRHLGGPLKYADWLGPVSIIQLCDRYAHLGPLYHPTEAIRNRARANSHYHPVKSF
jgi:3-hydroxyacyl-CoA dehydrogenase/enoyl-CoA hydratase/3-hydroxybutyryl-CoA epimerase/enoyl-CoA isomerase